MGLRARTLLLVALAVPAVATQGGAGRSAAATTSMALAFVKDGRLAFVEADGTNRRVTNLTAFGFPVWSRDGRRIAFDGSARVWVMKPDGRPRTLLRKRKPGDCVWLDWSPNGRRLAYTLNPGCEGRYAIHAVNVDGRGRRRLRPPPTCCAAWSPDGRRILFIGRGLSVMRADGRDVRRIPRANVVIDNPIPMRPPASWARTGKKIYYRGWAARRSEATLMVIDASGKNARDLTPRLRVFSFALSRDGRRIAIAASEGDRPRDVYVLEADGTGLRNLTPGGGAVKDDDPQWSPDGTKLAFVRWSGLGSGPGIGNPGQIWIMNADGSAQTNLTNDAADAHAPAWRPRSG